MQGQRIEQLKNAGVDVDEVLERLGGSEALLERFLKKFAEDPNYGKLVAAIGEHDEEGALTASHTLKGVCGNLSMKTLFDLLTRQVASFRAGDWQGAADMMPEITQSYERVLAVISVSGN